MMKKLTILVDMDDTIEQLTDAWICWLNEKHNTSVKRSDITSWDFSKAFSTISKSDVYAPLYIDEFWDYVKPIDGAAETLLAFKNKGHEIYIVTNSAYETIKAKMTKVLFKYFPFIDWEHVIVASNKQMILGDVLIDDAPHNLSGFPGVKVLMSAPHNANYDSVGNGMLRVSDWNKIFHLINFLEESKE